MNSNMPTAHDVKIFVPAQDFSISSTYYQSLGWQVNWEVAGLAEMELGGQRFLLQDYYHKDWAENFMMYIMVENAQAWYEHISDVLAKGEFPGTRVNPPKEEAHATVTYAWDPCGVLLHFAQTR